MTASSTYNIEKWSWFPEVHKEGVGGKTFNELLKIDTYFVLVQAFVPTIVNTDFRSSFVLSFIISTLIVFNPLRGYSDFGMSRRNIIFF